MRWVKRENLYGGVERSAYVTAIDANWKQIGKEDFANTKFMMSAGNKIYTLEKDGSLYQVNAE